MKQSKSQILKSKKKNKPTQFIKNWLRKFVEVPHPAFADMPPCPYARQARMQDKIKFMEINTAFPEVNIYLEISKFDFDNNDVLVMILPADDLTVKQTQSTAITLNKQFRKSDIVVLEDHPQIKEQVQSVKLNNGQYILFLAQRLSKLNKASSALKRTGYYKNWTKQYFDHVVTSRDPQSS